MVPPDSNFDSNQGMLDIDQVRVLAMSHKYNPSSVHAGLLIYSVDGQTDFILNDALLRIKSGDILIHQTHNALSGDEDLYRGLIRTLFGTHRINLVGLVFTFSGDGQYNEYMRWEPTSAKHITPIHPTEKKLLELVLVSLYMNHAWLSMPITSHIDVERLSQSTKKDYLLKLGQIEHLFNKRRQERHQYESITKYLNFNKKKTSDNFRSFQWTPDREQRFDATIQHILDDFYNLIHQIFQSGEFDRDRYAYFDDSTKQLATTLVSPYARLQAQPVQNYSLIPKTYL
jgi:hypothetical protein